MRSEHPAVSAWRECRPDGPSPQLLDILQEENQKTTVYRLGQTGVADSAVIAKRCPQRSALIERTIYEEILPQLPFPGLQYYGCTEEPNGKFWWLFIEDVSDENRYQPHLHEHRVAAARWLGTIHLSAANIAAASRLPERRANHYLSLLWSARDVILGHATNPALRTGDRTLLNTIVAHCEYLDLIWRQLEAVCEAGPCTLVHGDFIKKNVAVRTGRDGVNFLPYDWEKAGWGTPAEDISRVDIPTYWATVQDCWSGVTVQALQRLAAVGKIFRCIVFLHWLAPGPQHKSVEEALADMRRCENWLADLLRAATWQE